MHSNLMRTVVTKAKDRRHDGSPVMDPEIFKKVGNLTFEQLSSLRHRGAFSTVSLTFARCCQLSQCHNSSDLLEIWYKVRDSPLFTLAIVKLMVRAH